jgi:hypothetical protein
LRIFEDERPSSKRIAALALKFPQSRSSSPGGRELPNTGKMKQNVVNGIKAADRALWPALAARPCSAIGGIALRRNVAPGIELLTGGLASSRRWAACQEGRPPGRLFGPALFAGEGGGVAGRIILERASPVGRVATATATNIPRRQRK